jgi:CBS domain-containing protein
MSRDPVCVTDDTSLAAAAELLDGYAISGVPVIDGGTGELLGVISQTDLVRLRGSDLPWRNWHGLVVRDIMTAPAVTIGADRPTGEAARLMTEAGVHRLVVVDAMSEPIGVISESDVLHEIADFCDDG